MNTTQETMQEIEHLYDKYEKAVRDAAAKGYLTESTVKTYLIHSGNFVKWCKGNFVPGSRNATY